MDQVSDWDFGKTNIADLTDRWVRVREPRHVVSNSPAKRRVRPGQIALLIIIAPALLIEGIGELAAPYIFLAAGVISLIFAAVVRDFQMMAIAAFLIPSGAFVYRLGTAGVFVSRRGVKIKGLWRTQALPWTGLWFTVEPRNNVSIMMATTPAGDRTHAPLGQHFTDAGRRRTAEHLNEIAATLTASP